MASQASPTDVTGLHTEDRNMRFPEGCIELQLQQLEFVPWNNSVNIVSEEFERYTRKTRVIMLTILFFIGGPGNIINMAVFFKQGIGDRVNLLLFSLSFADCVYLTGALVIYGEELFLSLGRENHSGPILMFVINNNLTTPLNFDYISFFLSAAVACERCYCVLRPLKYQTLMRTRTTGWIIAAACVVFLVLGGIVESRYYYMCAYDPNTGTRFNALSAREFYLQNQDLIDYLDIVLFGLGLPVGVAMLVVVTTAVTAIKLREIVAWRSRASSALSAKEVALTKMLIGTSLLLITCLTPSVVFRIARLFLPEMNTTRRNQNFFLTCLWISHMFIYVNSSVNIFVYFAMGKRYRDTFWNLWKNK